MLGLIDELAEQGKAVVMCTHLLLEAEGLADQVVVMDQGHMLVAGLAERAHAAVLAVDHASCIDAEDPAMLDRRRGFPFVRSYERNGVAMVELDDRERTSRTSSTRSSPTACACSASSRARRRSRSCTSRSAASAP